MTFGRMATGMRARRGVVVATSLFAALAGCGGSGSAGTPPTESTSGVVSSSSAVTSSAVTSTVVSPSVVASTQTPTPPPPFDRPESVDIAALASIVTSIQEASPDLEAARLVYAKCMTSEGFVVSSPVDTVRVKSIEEERLFGPDHLDEEHSVDDPRTAPYRAYVARLEEADRHCYPPYDAVYQIVHDAAVAASLASVRPPVGLSGDCGNRPTGSSSVDFTPVGGIYAVFLLAFDPASRAARFDVVHWLSGDEARQASLRDHPDDPDGPSNDYYLVNDNDLVRTATVRTNATVTLTHLRTDGNAVVEPDTLDVLGSYLSEGSPEDVYWLTFDAGQITAICEQYRP